MHLERTLTALRADWTLTARASKPQRTPALCCPCSRGLENKKLTRINLHLAAGETLKSLHFDVKTKEGVVKRQASSTVRQYLLIPESADANFIGNATFYRNIYARELEQLMGFPRSATMGLSEPIARGLLGRSWHVGTAVFVLRPLARMTDEDWVKRKYPKGSTKGGLVVWSLFDGIGATSVALDQLGIRVKTLVTSEIDKNAEAVVSWRHLASGKKTQLVSKGSITGRAWQAEGVEELIREYGLPHLILAGPPCVNLSSANRSSRDGLFGAQSSLFYRYIDVLRDVRSYMGLGQQRNDLDSMFDKSINPDHADRLKEEHDRNNETLNQTRREAEEELLTQRPSGTDANDQTQDADTKQYEHDEAANAQSDEEDFESPENIEQYNLLTQHGDGAHLGVDTFY